jgi:hypothetical protein
MPVPVVALCLLAAAPGQPPAAAKTDAPAGSFLRRVAAGFEPLPANAPVATGEFLVALPGATLVSANGAVAVTCRADLEGTSPLPILETAVAVNPPADLDLDITLDRGRIDLVNRKPTGRAVARVTFGPLKWVVGLDSPGTRAAVEVISRWPAGSAFHRVPTDGHDPAGAAVLVVLAGTAFVSDGRTTLALSAPPGPAMVEWASTENRPLAARRLDALPAWADPARVSPAVKEARDAAEVLRAAFAAGPVGPALDKLLASAKPAEKRVGLIAAGATDDLERLTRAVAGAADPAVWDFGVSVLRHWVGRGPGQDLALFKYLVGVRQFTPAQAETVVRLLHGFSADDRARPETFEVLIEYLQNEQAAVRTLSAWHLSRLVPAGKGVPFRPAATRAECEAAYKAWKALIPAGQVPAGPARSSP